MASLISQFSPMDIDDNSSKIVCRILIFCLFIWESQMLMVKRDLTHFYEITDFQAGVWIFSQLTVV